jgi:hypothetical protein
MCHAALGAGIPVVPALTGWTKTFTDPHRSRLRSIQRRPDLINAFLGQTGLSLEPSPP